MQNGKISVDVFAKPTNSFTYVLPNTCYPSRNISNIPRGIALRIRRICDTDEKFCARSTEYSNYLIARNYNPSLVRKQFNEIGNLPRKDARKKKEKENEVSKIKFITTYNPRLPDINSLLKKHLPILHSDDSMKEVFPTNSITTIYKRNNNLREILSPSLYPVIKRDSSSSSVTSCGKCDICKNFLVISNKFTCKASGKHYFIRGNLNCESKNVIYIISCKSCEDQYVGSAVNFKNRFRVHKSNIKTNKDRCGTSRHFNN